MDMQNTISQMDPENGTSLSPTTATTLKRHEISADNYRNVPETSILLTVTALGCLGNIAAMATIICFRKYRKSSTAFICHQCFLDLIKCFYNFLYGFNLLHDTEVPMCYAVGASYLFFVTVSAYNLLAIVVNEEFELQSPSKHREKNHFCVIFGIAILWFMCILIDMGVAFLPKEPEFIPGVGSCIFSYGTPSNFVLHILWIILVSMATFLALSHFVSMYCRIRFKSKRVKWASIHRTLLSDIFSSNSNDADLQTVQHGCESSNLYIHLYLRRITTLTLMVLSFIIFWYPLFILTIIDYDFKQPKQAYKVLTILSWCHPATTPIFTFFILYDMSKKDGLMKRLYSNMYPMMQMFRNPTEHPLLSSEWSTRNSAIRNSYFSDNKEDEKQENQTLLQSDDDFDLTPDVTQNSVTMETPLKIEQWDSSPTSPGRIRPDKKCSK